VRRLGIVGHSKSVLLCCCYESNGRTCRFTLVGLTIGLMGLDETNLHVLMASGSVTEQLHAETVYKLLSRGKHWVLGMYLITHRHDIAHDDSLADNSI